MEGSDYEITDYSWPFGINGLTFFPRNNLSGKKWWERYITDEAGFLDESQYIFEFSKTKNGIEKMTVSIDNSKIDLERDGVESGPFRGSNYYFGEKWVIRDKAESTGGPCSECDRFDDSLQLIPILNRP